MDKLIAEQKRLKARAAWLCEEINCLTAEIDDCVSCAEHSSRSHDPEDPDGHHFGPGLADLYSNRARFEIELDCARAECVEVEKKLKPVKPVKAVKKPVKKAVKKP